MKVFLFPFLFLFLFLLPTFQSCRHETSASQLAGPCWLVEREITRFALEPSAGRKTKGNYKYLKSVSFLYSNRCHCHSTITKILEV